MKALGTISFDKFSKAVHTAEIISSIQDAGAMGLLNDGCEQQTVVVLK